MIEIFLITIILGPKPHFFTLEGNLHGGLVSRPVRITLTQWCGKGCPHIRPHPGLTNLEFGRDLLYFCKDTFSLFSGEKPYEPRVKNQCSPVTVIDWYNFFRDICGKALISLKWKLGAHNILVVEMDDSVFAKKRKYDKGSVPSHQQWVFGMI